ncbi:WSC-domain-containing protein [Viridothelium virens]|uniref:WSC-domain-containing protein n=1 Tax=Viridothelium virens TaxID=1048519 RepID=A0A6A6H772_VIRVR|nr:WSC-domain-containing protein [Viridothelium virens]
MRLLARLSFLACSFLSATAQQYAGDTISAFLPTISRAEVAFFRIPDPTGADNNLTLINYYSHGTNGQRIVESNIQRAIIVIHGLLRDPWNYANDTLNALEKVTDPNINQDSVAVIAPYFTSGDDKGYAYPWSSTQGSTTNALVWKGSQWSAGANNQYPRASTDTSSFTVLDTLIQYFDDATLFPNLKQITIVGHSMGGQMAQRYAVLSTQQSNTPVTHWVGNPDSYAWLSTDRPLSTADCPTYDNYRSGYSDFTDYPMTYGADLVAQGRDVLLSNYQSKQIAYGRATLDHGDDSDDCAPYSTGEDRNERFFYYIKAFGPSCDDPSGTNCDTVDYIPVTHDNGQMFGSSAGLARLFTDNFYGDGNKSYDFGYPRQQSGDDPYPNPSLVNTPPVTDTSTYAGNLTYQGCWSNQYPETAQALPTILYDNSSNTRQLCTSACVGAGFTIAGVQNTTQCLCGDTLNSQSAVLTVDSQCLLDCPGNSSEFCGGNARLSLFSNGFPAQS